MRVAALARYFFLSMLATIMNVTRQEGSAAGKMGAAWDVANAALFLASEETNFIPGAALPVDGGALVRIG